MTEVRAYEFTNGKHLQALSIARRRGFTTGSMSDKDMPLDGVGKHVSVRGETEDLDRFDSDVIRLGGRRVQ